MDFHKRQINNNRKGIKEEIMTLSMASQRHLNKVVIMKYKMNNK